MKLSTKATYGLKACFVLAKDEDGQVISLSQLSRETGISASYLEQLFIKLKRAGLVEAERGASGGYRLAKPATEISIGQVMRTLEGDLDLVECLGKKGCQSAGACPTRNIWKRLTDGINNIADGISLQDMVDDYRAAKPESRNSERNVEL